LPPPELLPPAAGWCIKPPAGPPPAGYSVGIGTSAPLIQSVSVIINYSAAGKFSRERMGEKGGNANSPVVAAAVAAATAVNARAFGLQKSRAHFCIIFYNVLAYCFLNVLI